MDGKVFLMGDYKPGETAPPFHVWCRSTTVPHFDDDFGQIVERAARGENGETYHVPADMTYGEWKKAFVDGGSKEGLDEMAQDGKRSVIPDSIRGNFDDFEELSLSENEKESLSNLNKLSRSDGFEHGVFFRGGHQVGEPFDSSSKNRVKVDVSKIPPDTSIFHSHTNETPFSTQDFLFLLDERVEKIGVIAYNRDVYVASVGDGWRPSKEEFDQIVGRIEQELTLDLQTYPDFDTWTLEQRNYMIVREKAFRIAREFEWKMEGGILDG